MKTEFIVAVVLFSILVLLLTDKEPSKPVEPKVVYVNVPVVKEVIREVPVEKIVVKEVIKEIPVVKQVVKEVPVVREVIKEVPREVILPYNQRPCYRCRPPRVINPYNGGRYEYNNRSRYRQLYPRRYYFPNHH